MGILQNKIDFVAFVAVTMANPNGDPLNGNSPRTDYTGLGEMSDVCIKRKLRNRMQDLNHAVFVQSADRSDDGCGSLSERASAILGKAKEFKTSDSYAQKACETWLDVRSFGQVFAFKDTKGVSIGVRGPVSIHQGISVSPVQVEDMQITKSVNGENSDKPRSSDTMGMKHFVRFGFYKIKGSVNVQLAEKTGFTEEDAEVLKECLRTLFVNDASSARPEGSMEVVKLYWFRHNCKDGQYSSAKVHRSIRAELITSDTLPICAEDYRITLEPLDGLEPEILDGI
ncbi:MAG: type I-C CRISPR-associated protein Cas7/Csd2 [Clostridiales bacterium]|nr:type I-C CRISPR-associated protein Cas7/Csd2 [Clostridiales bacterium]